MQLSILGASGFVGKVVTARALDEGHGVTVLARTPEKLGDLRERVTVVQGNLFDPESTRATIEGADAVLSCAGPPLKGEFRPEQYGKAMEELVSAMRAQGVERIVTLGGAATIRVEGEHVELMRRIVRFVLGLIGPKVVEGKQLEYDVLSQSDLAWTVIRPPMISNGKPAGKLLTSANRLLGQKVDVEDLAEFMLNQIESTDWVRQSPLVASDYR